ncbi:MAG: hypothetical protein KF797_07335 [Flavobacteriales bacterium]|nr:hypothetical protein [Flavobacteriales bacterium]
MKRHLSLLSILHYAYGAFVCMSGLVAFVLIFLGLFIGSDLVADRGGDGSMLRFVGALVQTGGWVIFAVIEIWGLLNILSGYWISRRRNRTASQVIAAFNCLSIPFGLALGIFTFSALGDEEVKQEYLALPQGYRI